MQKKYNEFNTTISGKVIDATVKTLSEFGALGNEVLERLNVPDIKLDEQYPFELRNALFDEVLNRFGVNALYVCGVEYLTTSQKNLEEYSKYAERYNKTLSHFKDLDKAEKKLKGFFDLVTNQVSKTIKGVTQSDNNIAYGATIEKTKSFNYKIYCTTALKLAYEPYIRTTWEVASGLCIANYWNISMIFDADHSKEGIDWATFVWNITAKPVKDPRSPTEITMQNILKIRKAMLKEILVYADDQKKQLRDLSQHLGKYIPPQIHQSLLKGKYDTTIATRRKKLTIFFSDIANFTSTSEGLQPEDLTKYLNEYFSEMTTIALDCGATIDKYIGDAMMVFFGDPESNGEKEDARGCVEMALRMQERMKELQEKWSNEGFADPFQVRMGINTGYCNVGNFGSDQRLTYTIIGGEVNVAQRLESSADSNGILMSYETYAHAQDMIEVKQREAIKMKGISREIKVFSVVERKSKAGNKQDEIKKKPTKRDQSQIEKLEKDMLVMKNNIEDLNKNVEKILKKF